MGAGTAGGEHGAGRTGPDDSLYVLTAVLLTPAQFPSVLGDDYPQACRALGLEPYAEGYGLVLGQDGAGARWTVAVSDVSLVAVAVAAWDCGMEYDLSPGEDSVVCALPGWPLALSVAAPGVPAPHDPPAAPGDPAPLAPADTSAWGAAQRRLAADEIALQWTSWREQLGDDDFPAPGADPGDSGGWVSRRGGVHGALADLERYLEDPPPPGRIRSMFAPGGARMLRADGPGWSLVARTDDIAFVLLDERPEEVLPVGRGSRLPALLTGLDAMAVRPG
ncbi:hypothetical protein [Streptomyces sp. CC77]|uniref:hypothetical protein n=1 Tax=Streptomyces sp. CC77 TaxID=1906739 RepID=UPI0008DDA8CD|nr:hypothetical protein [Streptomyces sp. CC77]OII66430.1 hypothetical protein BJP39_28305 [Streptomyces sp. CC77]